MKKTKINEAFKENTIEYLKKQLGKEQVVLGLSGGVDSSVTAVLLHKAIGDKLIPIFVDTGLMRKNEPVEVKALFEDRFNMNLCIIDASELFIKGLAGVKDPEKKRKIIGKTFIDVFKTEADKYDNVKWLAQGTIWPDVLESETQDGKVAIKSHHNVGGLPKRMKMKLIEPLRELYKWEVHQLGELLGMPKSMIYRHPFPGPGLAIRVIGEVTEERIKLLQEVDSIFINELLKAKIYDNIWQAFAILIPVKSVGIRNGKRCYEHVCCLRAVQSTDALTADWVELPAQFLRNVSKKIINDVTGVNRVVFDISTKPPATIEWE